MVCQKKPTEMLKTLAVARGSGLTWMNVDNGLVVMFGKGGRYTYSENVKDARMTTEHFVPISIQLKTYKNILFQIKILILMKFVKKTCKENYYMHPFSVSVCVLHFGLIFWL